ncbi:MAG: hypothetical protein ABEJ40_08105 [Haloarculaceae archaeon]
MATKLPARETANRSEIDGLLLCVLEDCARREFGAFFEAIVLEAMAAEGIEEVSRGEPVDLDAVAGVYGRVGERTGENTVVLLGRRTAGALDWGRDVSSVGEALESLGSVYDGLGEGDVGRYAFRRTGETSGFLSSTTPLPSAFERGLVRGVGSRFGDGEGFVTVDRADTVDRVVASRSENRDATAYECRWWRASGPDR